MLGLALQGQGRLDLAFERFRRCRADDVTLNLLYDLGLEFEKRRCFEDAMGIFAYIEQKQPGFRDCGKKMELDRIAVAGQTDSQKLGHLPSMYQESVALLERYRLEGELGRGLFGTVWHGYDDAKHREVAVKIIPLQERSMDEKSFLLAKSIFNRMADQYAILRHPNIIRVEESQVLEGKGVLVMEIHAGHSIEQYTSHQKRLPLPWVIQVIAKMAMALDHAHRLKIFHGGLKPGNVLFNEYSHEIKLTGFGQVMLLEVLPFPEGNHPWQRVMVHMAPEQIKGELPTRRSDIYALGRIFFQLVTGSPPPVEPVSGKEFSAEIPECLRRIIQKCLEPRPEKRFANCIDLARDLVGCVKSQVST
ncbi:MAG TPA: serine/threonine protein kinase [Magnetococcales bacterium]|nr:serine/threonine protein kinase [Magnetococcales bacterium]